MTSYLRPELPPIAMTTRDSEQLSRLADAAATTFPRLSNFLTREIERAHLISDVEIRPGLVTMGSEVEFRDDTSGQVRRVKLVYPEDADVSAGKISVLTPIGAALIGLSVSQSITFESPAGGARNLTVLDVKRPQDVS